jgi:hypothetical protein
VKSLSLPPWVSLSSPPWSVSHQQNLKYCIFKYAITNTHTIQKNFQTSQDKLNYAYNAHLRLTDVKLSLIT